MGDPKLSLGLVLHSHQPVGNLEDVFRQAYERAYAPFIDAVERWPQIRIVLHYTGPLLEWIERNDPEFIHRFRALIDRGQAEVLTGGFYEPILSMLPQRDRLGQIRRMTAWIEDRLGVSPRGMWLAERVWEPHLARDIARAGVEYCLIDDSPFLKVGLTREALHGYYITEEEGEALKVFPIDARLRDQIPFELPEKTEAYLREVRDATPTGLALFADDGEKLGDWPGTHKWVYEDGYLNDLFGMVASHESWLTTRTLSDYLDAYRALGIAYVPAASYGEMEEWSGGFWRNFLRRYPEAGSMHNKMLRVSDKVAAIPPEHPSHADAHTHLYRGQCNCPYWHGVFGGIYLSHLRHANYAELLRAERLADAATGRASQSIGVADLDYDGSPEYVLDGAELAVVLDPAHGGRLVELSAKREAHSLTATLSRRPEAYHPRLREKLQESGEHLCYDWYRRQALIDHFYGPGTTSLSFREAQYAEQGDFVDQPYDAEIVASDPASIRLWRWGRVWVGHEAVPVWVSKQVTCADASREVGVAYEIEHAAERPCELWFGVELNLALTAGDALGRYYQIDGAHIDGPGLAAMGERRGVRMVELIDEWLGLRVALATTEAAEAWWQPLVTVSQAVEQVDYLYQASTVVLSYRLLLAPGEAWRTVLRLSLAPSP